MLNWRRKIEEFKDDDKAFLRWIAANSAGYVLNCYKSTAKSGGPWMLHEATCHTLEKPNLTTGQYYKVCSTDRQELVQWADKERLEKAYDTALQICKKCNP